MSISTTEVHVRAKVDQALREIACCNGRQISAIVWKIRHEEGELGLEILATILREHKESLYAEHELSAHVLMAILSYGMLGVRKLAMLAREDLGFKEPLLALEVLWRAKTGDLRLPLAGASPFPDISQSITPEVSTAADQALKEFASDAITDASKFHILAGMMQMLALLGGERTADERTARSFVEVVAATSLRVSRKLLVDFEKLVSAEPREEDVHRFLTANPVFLDPLAKQLISKHKLGDDFITDFVLERLTADYIVVEIEKPQSRLFTIAGDFSAEFMHGFRQVLDFQKWIQDNVPYARNKLPNIGSPPGLLVIGRSSLLTDGERNRLRSFQHNSPHIQVLGFDDLLERTRILYENLLKD